MPKMKSKSGAAKRFRALGGGTGVQALARVHASHSHQEEHQA